MAMIAAAPLTERRCDNCACYFQATNAQGVQGFCRRDPPMAQQVRLERPRLDRNGKPVMKDGQPVMNAVQEIAYLYVAARADMVCWDGWRPKQTAPGDNWSQHFAVTCLIERALHHFGNDAAEILQALEAWRKGPALETGDRASNEYALKEG